MEGQYDIKASNKNYLKQRDLFQLIKITFLIYLFLLIVVILNNHNSISEILWLSMAYFALIGIALTLRYFTNSPLDNTIIMIKENEITRKGRGLRTVTIDFDKISDLKNVKYGVILFDEKFSSKVKYHFSRYAITHESGILFIPVNIEYYEEIRELIMSKIK